MSAEHQSDETRLAQTNEAVSESFGFRGWSDLTVIIKSAEGPGFVGVKSLRDALKKARENARGFMGEEELIDAVRLEIAAETSLGHAAIHETLEGIPVDDLTRPKID